MFVFDTDHIGFLQQQTSPECQNILGRTQAYRDEDFFVTIISFHEQAAGWNSYLSRARDKSAVVKAYERLHIILTDFSAAQVLPFDDAAADQFEKLRSQSVRISTMDLRIASITLVNNSVLCHWAVRREAFPEIRQCFALHGNFQASVNQANFAVATGATEGFR